MTLLRGTTVAAGGEVEVPGEGMDCWWLPGRPQRGSSVIGILKRRGGGREGPHRWQGPSSRRLDTASPRTEPAATRRRYAAWPLRAAVEIDSWATSLRRRRRCGRGKPRSSARTRRRPPLDAVRERARRLRGRVRRDGRRGPEKPGQAGPPRRLFRQPIAPLLLLAVASMSSAWRRRS